MIAALTLILLANPPGILIDRVVAVVDKDVVTHSELLREARVALVLRGWASAATAELSRELLDETLDYLVDQLIVGNQARRYGGAGVSEEEVDAGVERFAQRLGGPIAHRAFLRRFDIAESAVRDILRRRLRNERFIQQRMRAWRSGESGDPAEAEARYLEALEHWLAELRQGVEVRRLGPSGELELGDRAR